MSDDVQAQLVAEQVRRAIDALRADIQRLEQGQAHFAQLTQHRLQELEKSRDDHETRIRSASEGVTQFKVWSGLSSGGAWLVSVIALIRTWFAGG